MIQTNQLIVIGAPSCAGKSHLIRLIKQGMVSNLRGQLAITDPSLWLYAGVNQLPSIRQNNIERLMLHYDFYSHPPLENESFYVNSLLRHTNNIIVVTLCLSPKTILQRNTKRIVGQIFPLTRFVKTYQKRRFHINRLMTMRKLYKNKSRFFDLYSNWFKYLDKLNLEGHLLIDSNQTNMFDSHPYESDDYWQRLIHTPTIAAQPA